MDSKFILKRRDFTQGAQPYIRPYNKKEIDENYYMNSSLMSDILKESQIEDTLTDSSYGVTENIYENMAFLISLQNKENRPILPEPLKGNNTSNTTFVSTFAIEIGAENTKEVTHNSIETVSTLSQYSDRDSYESDPPPFKSTYAQKLADSYQRRSSSPNIPLPVYSFDTSTPMRRSPDMQQVGSTLSTPRLSPMPGKLRTVSKEMESMHAEISQLVKGLSEKEQELSLTQKNLLNYKLEINRLKAENRSLKRVQQTLNQSAHLASMNSDHSQSVSITDNTDVWSLQKQVAALTKKLEKAEVTRHAYESATRQLVQFLQTINSTLTTITVPDHNNQSDIHDTNKMLSNLLKDSCHTVANTPVTHNGQVRKRNINSLENSLTLDPLKGRYKKGDKAPPIKRKKEHNSRQVTPRSSKSKRNPRPKDKPSDVTPRFSFVRSTFKKSGSVNDLRSLPTQPHPRVSRAASSHCIGTAVIEDQSLRPQKRQRPSSLVITRNKGFFSSLKNLFRIDSDKHSDTTTNTSKKKSHFPFYRKSKPDVSVVSSDLEVDHSLQSSTFYVSYEAYDPVDDICSSKDNTRSSIEEEDKTLEDFVPDLGPSLLETIDNHHLSGPQELSMALATSEGTDSSGYVASKAETLEQHEQPVEASKATVLSTA